MVILVKGACRQVGIVFLDQCPQTKSYDMIVCQRKCHNKQEGVMNFSLCWSVTILQSSVLSPH